MLIRLTQNSKGIEHYFQTGQKSGRTKDRDELDKRVHLSGDLEAFSRAVKRTNNHKTWKAHYWHITGSFHLKNQDTGEDTIRKIHQEMLEYYFCRYASEGADLIEKIIHASEIHRPKHQTNETGLQQRLIHFHVAVSKLDPTTGNQLRIIPFKHKADQAFQNYLALKYRLENPAIKKRLFGGWTLENWILHHTGKQTVGGPEKESLSQYKDRIATILEGAETLEEAKSILNGLKKTGDINEFSLKRFPKDKKKPVKNRYFKIHTDLFPKKGQRGINLQGKTFEHLERLYYTHEEQVYRKGQGKYVPPPMPKHWKSYSYADRILAIEEQKAIFKAHQDWWINEGIKAKKKILRNAKNDFKALEERFKRKYEIRAKAQRIFFVIYKKNIALEPIRGYSIWERNNTRYLINNDWGIKIYDCTDKNKIVIEYPDDPMLRKKAIATGLEVAIAKHWDIRTIRVFGSDEFKEEVRRQIDALYASDRFNHIEPVEKEMNKQRTNSKLNAVDYLQAEDADKRKAYQTVSKERIQQIKKHLKPRTVINWAIANWGLPNDSYTTYKKHKIIDKRTGRAKNVIDFLTETCNRPLSEVFPLLDEFLKRQEALAEESKAEKESPSEVVNNPDKVLQDNIHFDPDDPFPENEFEDLDAGQGEEFPREAPDEPQKTQDENDEKEDWDDGPHM